MIKFETVTENHQTFKRSFCGNYKVIRYGKFFYAYFKPDGYPNFGNNCEKPDFKYKTETGAIAGARRHNKAFKNDLNFYNRIRRN